jgi:protein O-mannosyl-transferase
MGRKSRARKLESAQPSPALPQPLEGQSSVRTTALIAGALVLLTLAVYARVSSHEFLDYDDNVYITQNAVIRQGLTLQGLRWALTSMDVNWHPLTWVTHMTDVELFGLDAGKHHLVNVAFHIANVVLVFLLLQRMTAARWRSAIVAALFAVHPMHVESVAWIAERKDVLSTLFFLLTLWLYVIWTERKSAGIYVAMLATFILGLASKQMLVTLPFVLLLLDYWPLRRLDLERTSLASRVVEKIPLFVITVIASVVAFIAQRSIKAIVSSEVLPFGTRAGNAIQSYVTYLWKTFLPTPLALPYPYTFPKASEVVICAIVLLAITATVIAYRDRRHLVTGWFWFVGTLVPVIGLIQIGAQSMADRYTYIPHIGLLAAIVWLAGDIAAGWKMERVFAGAAAIVIGAFAFAATSYAAVFRNTESLFRHDVIATRNNFVAHSLLGSILLKADKTEEAKEHFTLVLRSNPKDLNSLFELADIELKNGRTAEGLVLLERARQVDPSTRAEAEIALANGDAVKAIEKFRIMVKKEPHIVDHHVDLAAALALAGKDEESLAENRVALKLDPAHYEAHMNVGALLSRMGRNDEALADFRKAAEINPSSPEPHVYLALLYVTMERKAEALAEARLASQVNHAASNLILTNALRMPHKPTNLDEFIAFLEKG